MNPAEILSLPLRDNDVGAVTIGNYLMELLMLVWDEEEGFDGKRPFGNSDWQSEIIHPLVDARLIKGKKTIHDANTDVEWVEYEDVDYKTGEMIITNCIAYAFANYW